MPLQNSPKCFPRRAKLLRRRAGQREPKDRSHTAVPDETTSIISFNQINFTKYNKSWNRAIISLSYLDSVEKDNKMFPAGWDLVKEASKGWKWQLARIDDYSFSVHGAVCSHEIAQTLTFLHKISLILQIVFLQLKTPSTLVILHTWFKSSLLLSSKTFKIDCTIIPSVFVEINELLPNRKLGPEI